MKLPLGWLKTYVSWKGTEADLAHRLTLLGFEVESRSRVEGETVFEIEVTPNRSDALSVLGLAREVAAGEHKPLNPPSVVNRRPRGSSVPIDIQDARDCPRYIGTRLRDIGVKSSPAFLKKRLNSVGVRAINNAVDITNFCLWETGQPLHVFDYDKLEGGRIIVRRAQRGESIVTLDGEKRELDPEVLVIADARRPVAIAGIMGGLESQVDENTRTVLLESAAFNPHLIRRMGRKLGLGTDSSYRFERGTDIQGVAFGADRAVTLLEELGGGRVDARRDLFPGRKGMKPRRVSFSPERVSFVLGTDVSAAQCRKILSVLGFHVERAASGRFRVTVPSFRRDVSREEDLVEDVARVIGYDRLPMRLPSIKVSSVSDDEDVLRERSLRRILTGQGLDEVITYSLGREDDFAACGFDKERCVFLRNPLSREQAALRPHLLPSHLRVVAHNLHRGQKNIRFFELGKVYAPSREVSVVALTLTGRREEDWRLPFKKEVDFFDLKGLVDVLTGQEKSFLEWRSYEEGPLWAQEAAVLIRDGRRVGEAGRVPMEMLRHWGMKKEAVYFAQIEIAGLKGRRREKLFQPIPEYPPIIRDISMALDKSVLYADVVASIRQAGGTLLQEVNFIELYEGEKIPSHQKGLVISCVYQSRERTLTEEEVHPLHDTVCQTLVKRFSATIR